MSQHDTGQPKSHRSNDPTCSDQRGFGSLQYVLWTLWTLAVLTCAYITVRSSLDGGMPVDILGLVIRCTVVGLIGLVVITMTELHLEPERFPDDDPPDDD